MNKNVAATLFISIFLTAFAGVSVWKSTVQGAPPYDIATDDGSADIDDLAWLRDWKRPEGPPVVAIQAGHWKNDELPDELAALRGSTGASGGGKSEWEVNLAIAEAVKPLLTEYGVTVDILPATVPPRYWADVFVAIHADGALDYRINGYKAASPRRDLSGNSDVLRDTLVRTYGEATGLVLDPNVSRNMRGYYAFAWRRRLHAVHPMTAAVILETGFLTSPHDRRIIVSRPDASARGIAHGILEYLRKERLLSP